jgi:protoporphyrin/coproporphyrin ferrochelatase
MKYAVVLFNLGGPDALSAVKPFLFNLFYDPAILPLPNPFRWMLAKFISGRRALYAQNIYKKIGGKSPIREETLKQVQALERALKSHGKYKVFYSMRYWKPFAEDVAAEVKKFNPDKIILLPLYPQFSTTTTESSLQQWHKVAVQVGLNCETRAICCYYDDKDFIHAYTELIGKEYRKALKLGSPRILFSAHGIPVNRIKNGDPYQYQVEKTVAAIVKHLGVKNLDYTICYQSKVGRLKWLEPAADAEIIQASQAGKIVVVAPISFVSEHSETLVELDIDYKKLALQNGCPEYLRVPTVRVHKQFIECLKQLCLAYTRQNCGFCSAGTCKGKQVQALFRA